MKTQFLAALIGVAALQPGAAQTVDTVLTNGMAEPYNAAVQGNAYYISDSANHRILAYNPGNGVVSSLAGFIGRPGSTDGKGVYARFNTPRGLVWVPALGGLVVADYGNQTLRLVKPDGKVTTLAGTPGIAALDPGPGPIAALSAHFNFPSALAADSNGNVFIADSKNNAIRKYDTINQLVWTVTQGLAQGLNQPNGIAIGDNGDLWVSNSRDHTIQRLVGGVPPAVLAAGTPGQSGALDSLFATQIPGFDVPGALFNFPGALLWLGTTNGLLVCDTGNHAIRRVYQDPDIIGFSVNTYAGVLGQAGLADGPLLQAEFNSPTGVTLDSIGGFLVADSGNNALRQIQTSAPQPPVSDPVIGWVSWQKDQFGDPVSLLVPVTHSVFNNDVIIAILAEQGTKTYFTSGATPSNSLQDTIPSPDDPTANRSTPSPYQDGLHAADVPPSIIPPQPDVTIKAVGTADNRRPSSIVQARFQFQTANPSVLGDNAASFVVTNITVGAQMWYTTDGSDPVANGPGNTNVVNGAVSLPRSSIPITFKIQAFRTGFTDSEVVTKIFSPEDFQANRISFGFEYGEASSDFVASAGQRFFAPVTLSLLPSQSMYTLQFYVTVTGLNTSSPVDPSTVGFESMLMEKITNPDGVAYRQIPPALFLNGQSGPPGVDFRPGLGDLLITNSSINLLAVGWLERNTFTNLYNTKQQDLITYSIAHDTLFLSAQQKVIAGGYSFVVPQNASAGDTYQIQIGRPSATSDGVNQDNYIEAVTDGTLTASPTNLINSIKWVTVGQRRYIVGDVAPFRWFNAGDFGDSLLLNNDVVQVFQSAIYYLNGPPVGSDFFDAMDSSNGLTNNLATNLFSGDDLAINSIQFGDRSLNVDDVYVTFRRSLDPSLTWYARYWDNGQLQAVPVGNVGRGVPSRPGQLLTTRSADLPGSSFIPGDPSASVSVDDSIVTPGQTLQIPVHARVTGNYPLRVLMLNLTVEPLDGSPPVTEPVDFAPATALGPATLTSSRGVQNFAGAWLNNQVAGVAGLGVLGTLTVVIPTNAPASAAYRVHFDHLSASPNGLGLFPKQVQDGLLTLRDRSSSSLGDGIPDTWRLRYFGSVSDPLAQANADPDGDGISNLAEYLAGTSPVDPDSRLRLVAHRQVNAGNGSGSLTLRWPSCLNKCYTVEATSSLTSGTWTVLGSGLVGTGQDLEFTPAVPVDSTQFFRVRVSD